MSVLEDLQTAIGTGGTGLSITLAMRAKDEIERLRNELKKPILVGRMQIEACKDSDSYWVYPVRRAEGE